jgi:hypothetical protein
MLKIKTGFEKKKEGADCKAMLRIQSGGSKAGMALREREK